MLVCSPEVFAFDTFSGSGACPSGASAYLSFTSHIRIYMNIHKKDTLQLHRLKKAQRGAAPETSGGVVAPCDSSMPPVSPALFSRRAQCFRACPQLCNFAAGLTSYSRRSLIMSVQCRKSRARSKGSRHFNASICCLSKEPTLPERFGFGARCLMSG